MCCIENIHIGSDLRFNVVIKTNFRLAEKWHQDASEGLWGHTTARLTGSLTGGERSHSLGSSQLLS